MAPLKWRVPADSRPAKVTALELFFDLVFVLTLTQLAQALEHDLSWAGAGRVLLVFGVLWWMYGGYVWLTNHVSPVRPVQRLLMLAGMAGFLVTAVATPHVFDGSGVIFGVGYLVVIVAHLVLFSQSGNPRAVARLAPFNLAAAGMVLGAGVAEGAAAYALVAAALVLQFVTPYLGVAPQFDLRAAHFVERHGLLVLVALGESVVAIGMGVDTDHLTGQVALLVALALALPAALWWAYFSGDDEAAEHTLAQVDAGRRALLAIRGYFYAHVPMLLGIVAIAAGIHEAIAHPGEPLALGGAVALAGGVTLFFVGDAEFRRTLDVGPLSLRLGIAVVALATIPVGTALGGAWQLLALVVVVAAGLAIEEIRTRRPVVDPGV